MIIHGDSIEELRKLDAESVDALVTDPPYGLGNTNPKHVAECLRAWSNGETWESSGRGFMGKRWDSWVPPPELWREVFRVMKHGAHGLVFAGSRTQDLMSISLRLAGFEIRDTLQWVYGSGFPKSHSVSKAIDKQRYTLSEIYEVTSWIRATRDTMGLTNREIDDAFGFNGVAGHWTSTKTQPAVPPLDQVPKLLEVLGVQWNEIPPRVQHLLVEFNSRKGQPAPTWFAREVIGSRNAQTTTHAVSVNGESPEPVTLNITASATDEARKWAGWGTALKPAYEPAILIRKPLDGTVAQNVLKHDTGALNIDATRIALKEGESTFMHPRAHSDPSIKGSGGCFQRSSQSGSMTRDCDKGRWPANVLIDEESALALDAQAGGNVSRFFYCSKASKREREAGLDGFQAKDKCGGMLGTANKSLKTRIGNERNNMRKNTHPTVKPLDLMRYLCRLITPPRGLVLDPFAGSGSTLCAGTLEGFRVLGIEREAEYVKIARARLAHWREQSEPSEPSEPSATSATSAPSATSATSDQLSLFDD